MNGMHYFHNYAYNLDSDDYTVSYHWELPPTPTILQLSLTSYYEFDDQAHAQMGFTHVEYLDSNGVPPQRLQRGSRVSDGAQYQRPDSCRLGTNGLKQLGRLSCEFLFLGFRVLKGGQHDRHRWNCPENSEHPHRCTLSSGRWSHSTPPSGRHVRGWQID
jgi:hypothetical protein